MTQFSDLVGKVIKDIRIESNGEEIRFYTDGVDVYHMYHSQDCCESVYIHDIDVPLYTHKGGTVLEAEERMGDLPAENPERDSSWTWTFYYLRTTKSTSVITWYGCSDGHYSERVDFVRDGEEVE